MIKSAKGITLGSVVIYIVAFTLIAGIVGTIISFFYSSTTNLSDASVCLGEFNKFNTHFLEEVKKQKNEIQKLNGTTQIIFTTGTSFTFQDGIIYKNKAKICEGVNNCNFTIRKQEEKTIVVVYIEIGKNSEFVRTIEYIMDYTNEYSSSNLYEQGNASEYVKEGLILHYDGINNTGTGHSSATSTWRDLSGNGNDGTLKNFAYNLASGWQENGLTFDGLNTIVESSTSGTNFSQFASGVPFSCSVTFKTGISTQESWNGVLSNMQSWGNGGFCIQYGSSQDIALGCGTYIQTTGLYATNTNYQVCVTYNGSIVKLYVNGDLKTTTTYSILAGDSTLKLGCFYSTGSLKTNGDIYNVKFYNKELSNNEIEQNYEIDKARFDI